MSIISEVVLVRCVSSVLLGTRWLVWKVSTVVQRSLRVFARVKERCAASGSYSFVSPCKEIWINCSACTGVPSAFSCSDWLNALGWFFSSNSLSSHWKALAGLWSFTLRMSLPRKTDGKEKAMYPNACSGRPPVSVISGSFSLSLLLELELELELELKLRMIVGLIFSVVLNFFIIKSSLI